LLFICQHLGEFIPKFKAQFDVVRFEIIIARKVVGCCSGNLGLSFAVRLRVGVVFAFVAENWGQFVVVQIQTSPNFKIESVQLHYRTY
jgi:hypothetical protein